MIGILAAMVLTQAGGLQPDARLDAFREACIPHRRDIVRAAKALAGDGWARVNDDDHPELAASLGKVKAEAVDPELNMAFDYSVWAREIEGRRLHVVLTRVDAVLREADLDEDGDGEIQPWERRDVLTFLGCGLWDFEATEAIHPGLMTAWTGGLAVQTIDQPGVLTGGTWNVNAMLPGTGEVHLGFIPAGSPMIDRAGFSGVSINMTSAPERPEEDDSTR